MQKLPTATNSVQQYDFVHNITDTGGTSVDTLLPDLI